MVSHGCCHCLWTAALEIITKRDEAIGLIPLNLPWPSECVGGSGCYEVPSAWCHDIFMEYQFENQTCGMLNVCTDVVSGEIERPAQKHRRRVTGVRLEYSGQPTNVT
jgi:hypothetical protein